MIELIIAKTARMKSLEKFAQVNLPLFVLTPDFITFFFPDIQFVKIFLSIINQKHTIYIVPIDETVLGLKFEWMTVTITIFLLLIFVIGGFSVGICFCRRKFVENISDEKSLASNHLNHQYDLDNSKHLNSYRPAVSGNCLRQYINNCRKTLSFI